MLEVIGQVLGNAVGVAISPVPIIAVILMLFTPKAMVNSISFLAGWLVGLLGAGLIVLALGLETSEGEASDTQGIIKIVIGVAFLGLAVKQWSGRPAEGEEPAMPAWMASIDTFTPVRSFGLAVLLAGVNPKNLGLTIAAVATIGSGGLDSSEEIVVLVVFTVIASLTVALPVVLNLVLGDRAQAPLDAMRQWLGANNATVMAVLFVVLGAKVLGDGLSIVA